MENKFNELKSITFLTKYNTDIIYKYNNIVTEQQTLGFVDTVYYKEFLNKKKKNCSKKLISSWMSEVEKNLDECINIFEVNINEIQEYFKKMYNFSISKERLNDIEDVYLFNEYREFGGKIPKNINFPGFFFTYLFENLEKIFSFLSENNNILLWNTEFKCWVENFLIKRKNSIIKILLAVLKDFYLRQIINKGSFGYPYITIDRYFLDSLLISNLFNFIFKLGLFSKEEFLTLHYIIKKTYCWAKYRDDFIIFSPIDKGTEQMRRNICKNLSIAPLEYCLPDIDIYEVYQRILKNKDWLVHPEMLLEISLERIYKCYDYYFNYFEIEKLEDINNFYWEEFLKCDLKEKEEKVKKKYWYFFGWSYWNWTINDFYIVFSEKEREQIEKFFLDPKDYPLGDEWSEEMKNWKNFLDSASDEIVRSIKYWGWEEYRSVRKLDISFEEYVEMNNLNITWEEASKNV